MGVIGCAGSGKSNLAWLGFPGTLAEAVADHVDWQKSPLGEPAEPYEPLQAALAGDHQLFARQDSVEETWRIEQPLLDQPADIRPYLRGSWGPDDAEALIRGRPRWQPPWLPADG